MFHLIFAYNKLYNICLNLASFFTKNSFFRYNYRLFFIINQYFYKKNINLYQINVSGGERGVRTLAPLTRPNSLANCPLHHLGISPYYFILIKVRYLYISYLTLYLLAERVGFEPTVRYKRTPIFKTGAINQLDHLSILS